MNSGFEKTYQTMKKYIVVLFISLVLLTYNLQAQDNYKRFHIGPRIGLLISDVKYNDFYNPTSSEQYNYIAHCQFAEGGISYTNMNLNYSIGLAFEYDIVPIKKLGVSIQIVPQYTRKGCWYASETTSGLTGNIYMHYVEFPMELRGKCRISKNNNLVVGFGPTFNIGIKQKNKNHMPVEDEIQRFSTELQFGDGDSGNGLYRLDIGANAILGIEMFRGFRFDLSYNIPFRNLSIDKSKSVKHFVFAVSIGYMF